MPDSVHTCLNLPSNGSSLALGPVTIAAKYPADTTTGGKRRRNIMVKDASGSTKLTCWGAAADLPFVDGSTIILKGSIKKNEWPKGSGTFTLFSESLVIEGGGAQQNNQQGNASSSQSSGGEIKINHVDLAEQMAAFTYELQEACLAKGLLNETVQKIIVNAPHWASLWWFGAKQLDMSIGAPVVEDEDASPY